MSSTDVQIYRRCDGTLVDATLHVDLDAIELPEVESKWGPIRRKRARELHKAGKHGEIPEHWAWNWESKKSNLSLINYRCFGIKCDDEMQGLMMTKLSGQVARLDPDKGKEIVYIDYLESAPWNVRRIVKNPKYGGIGAILMYSAVQLSIDEGFNGRVGLHALPQSEEFYRDDCEMMCCGKDPSYQDLPYYEMTAQIAARFMTKASRSES